MPSYTVLVHEIHTYERTIEAATAEEAEEIGIHSYRSWGPASVDYDKTDVVPLGEDGQPVAHKRLVREEIMALRDGHTVQVKLYRLWNPTPQLIYEGEAVIARNGPTLGLYKPYWAEYLLPDDFATSYTDSKPSGVCLVTEDYMAEFFTL